MGLNVDGSLIIDDIAKPEVEVEMVTVKDEVKECDKTYMTKALVQGLIPPTKKRRAIAMRGGVDLDAVSDSSKQLKGALSKSKILKGVITNDLTESAMEDAKLLYEAVVSQSLKGCVKSQKMFFDMFGVNIKDQIKHTIDMEKVIATKKSANNKIGTLNISFVEHIGDGTNARVVEDMMPTIEGIINDEG